MTERRSRVHVIVGFVLAAAAAGVLGGVLEEATGQGWLRYALLVVVVVPAVLVLVPMSSAKFAASVKGDHRWYASSLRSTKSRMAWVGGVLALEADAVTFTPNLHIGRSRRYPLDSVAGVTGFADRPPRVRFDLRHGEPVAISVFPTVRSTIRTQDTSARDEALRAIAARLRR